MKDTKVVCNLDNIAMKTKIPNDKVGIVVNRLKRSERAKAITLERLSQGVIRGYSFTSARLKGKTNNDWVSQQLFVLDIDNENIDAEKTSVNEAIKILSDNKIDYAFIYYSFSSTAENTRFRIVLCCDSVITDKNECIKMNKTLVSLFNQCDRSCVDLSRMYYATDKEEIIGEFKTFNKEDLLALAPKEETVNLKPLGEFKNDKNFDLIEAARDFNLVAYVESLQTCRIKQKGDWVSINPCPLCNHKDDFFVKNGIYRCHGANGNTSGNIITFLQNYKDFNFSKVEAVEYFKYQILKRDKQADIQAFKDANNKGINKKI